jgi:hypothetical protein
MLPAFLARCCIPTSTASHNAYNISNLTHPMSAADLNSRPSTKCCSRCHNIRPLTTFINDRNIELKTCHRCRRPPPQEYEAPTYATAGDTVDLLVRCSRCMRHHLRSMFLSSAGRRFKTCFDCRVCFLYDPLFEIY